MVVDANGKGITVEADVVGQCQMATGLESNPDRATRPQEGMKPLEDRAKDHLDATTSLEDDKYCQ